jgi:hypothetical protein
MLARSLGPGFWILLFGLGDRLLITKSRRDTKIKKSFEDASCPS